jgi:hypothetical protein
MTLSQQAAIVLEAVEHELLRVEGIIRWADGAIVASEKPETWLIDLSTLNPSHVRDFVSLLRTHAAESLPQRWRVQIIVLAFDAGLLSLASSLPLLFRLLIVERWGAEKDSADEQLADALVAWDCQENLDVIPPVLHARFETLFRGYLADAHEISAVLLWRHEAVALHRAGANPTAP